MIVDGVTGVTGRSLKIAGLRAKVAPKKLALILSYLMRERAVL